MQHNFTLVWNDGASIESQALDALARGFLQREAFFDPDDDSDNDDESQDEFGNDLTTGEFATSWQTYEPDLVPPVFRRRATAVLALFKGEFTKFERREVSVWSMGVDIDGKIHWRMVGSCLFGGQVVEMTVFVSLWDGEKDMTGDALQIIVRV